MVEPPAAEKSDFSSIDGMSSSEPRSTVGKPNESTSDVSVEIARVEDSLSKYLFSRLIVGEDITEQH